MRYKEQKKRSMAKLKELAKTKQFTRCNSNWKENSNGKCLSIFDKGTSVKGAASKGAIFYT